MNSTHTKVLSVATLAIMSLGLAGCSVAEKKSEDTWGNANQTILTLNTLMQDEAFIGALQQFGTDGVTPSGFDKQFETMSNLIVDDADLEKTRAFAKESFAGRDDQPNDKALTLLAKASPLMGLSGTYSLSVDNMSMQVDSTGFDNKDGTWVQTKDGGLQIVDPSKRIFEFSLVDDNIAFTADGTKLSLKAFVQTLEDNKNSSTELQEDIFTVSTSAYEMIASGEKGEHITDMSKHEKEIIQASGKLLTDGVYKISGDSEKGFVVEGTSKKSGEVASYNVATGVMKSSLEGKGFDPSKESDVEETLAKQLFDEYSESLLSTYDDKKGTFSKVSEVIDGLNKNEILKDAVWNSTDNPSSAVAEQSGVKYTFGDLTEEMESAEEKPMNESSTNELLGVPETD